MKKAAAELKYWKNGNKTKKKKRKLQARIEEKEAASSRRES